MTLEELFAAEDATLNQATLRAWLQGKDGDLPTGDLIKTSLVPHDGRQPKLFKDVLKMTAPEVLGSQVVGAEERGEVRGGLETIVMGEFGPWDYPSGEERPVQRRAGGLLADVPFDCRWFRWTEAESDPRGKLDLWRALGDAPLAQAVCLGLAEPHGFDDGSPEGQVIREAVGHDHFGLTAHGRLEVSGGSFRLRVTSDDGVRVLIDGKVAFEDWTWHAPRTDESLLELAPGVHDVVVEYFQINGALALVVELEQLP